MNIDLENVFVAMREAGGAVMQIYKGDFKVQWKAKNDPLTKADLASDEILQKELSKYGYPIISEETEDDKARLKSDSVWIIDPIDGTSDFVAKNGEFCIMVGFVHFGKPIFGAIYIPTEDKLYYAEKGNGAFLKEGSKKKLISVSNENKVAQARAVVTRSHMNEVMKTTLTKISPAKTTPTGSNGIKAVRVAEGQAELFVNPTDKMGEWDLCAPHILVEEAGGIVTGAHGEELVYNKQTPNAPYGVLATNRKLHSQILKKL